MIRYALTRGALLLLGLFVASALIFVTLRVLPGDVAQVIAGLRDRGFALVTIDALFGSTVPQGIIRHGPTP